MNETKEMLEGVRRQVERLMLEPCSPVEAKLANAVAVLASIILMQCDENPKG